MDKPLILVTGATGKTGSAVVAQLRERDWAVRAAVHTHDDRSRRLEALGAEVVVADLYDYAQVRAAVRGASRAYFCPPISPYASMTLATFMHAAEQSRLESVVAMTQWLASPAHPTQMTRDMWAVEQLLPTLQGTAVTILNPGFFADNYLRVTIGMAAHLGLYPNFVGDSQNAPPSNEDMARVAVAVLADPHRHDGRRYRVTGPEQIGLREIVTALSRALGRKNSCDQRAGMAAEQGGCLSRRTSLRHVRVPPLPSRSPARRIRLRRADGRGLRNDGQARGEFRGDRATLRGVACGTP